MVVAAGGSQQRFICALTTVVVGYAATAGCGGKTAGGEGSGENQPDGPCSSRECRRVCPEPGRLAALVEGVERLVAYAETASGKMFRATRAIAAASFPTEEGPCPDDVASAYAAAVERVSAEVEAAEFFSVVFGSGRCTIDSAFAFMCETRCAEEARCDCPASHLEDRCEPGGLSGECAGECSGECSAADAPVLCDARCQGHCNGTCDAVCSDVLPDGRCLECTGTCTGTCDGQCQGSTSSPCAGICKGACNVEMIDARCESQLTPPSCGCPAAEKCFEACSAAASFAAMCSGPRAWVLGDVSADFAQTLQEVLPSAFEVMASAERVVAEAGPFLENLEDYEHGLSAQCRESGGQQLVDSVEEAVRAFACVTTLVRTTTTLPISVTSD